MTASQLAVEMADERYSNGLTMFLDVLQTQQALFQTQRNLVDSEAQLSTDLVALYKALGGGWQTQDLVNDTEQKYPGEWFDKLTKNVKWFIANTVLSKGNYFVFKLIQRLYHVSKRCFAQGDKATYINKP